MKVARTLPSFLVALGVTGGAIGERPQPGKPARDRSSLTGIAFAEPRGEGEPDLRRTFQFPPYGSTPAVVSPSGEMIAGGVILNPTRAGEAGHGVVLWELETGKQLRVLKRTPGTRAEGVVETLAFSPDGLHLGGGHVDGAATVWNVRTGRVEHTWPVSKDNRAVEQVAFSPDGRQFAAGTNSGRIQFWDLRTGALLRTLAGPRFLTAFAFSPDGRKFAAGCGVTLLDTKANLEKLKVGELKTDEEETTREIGELQVCDLPSGRQVWRRDGGRQEFVAALAFSPDSKLLVSGGEQLRAWNADTGERSWTQKVRPLQDREGLPEGHVLSLACSPDQRFVATTSVRLVKDPRPATVDELELWEIATGKLWKQVASLRDGGARRVAFSTDGRLFWCEEPENRIIVRVWNSEAP